MFRLLFFDLTILQTYKWNDMVLSFGNQKVSPT